MPITTEFAYHKPQNLAEAADLLRRQRLHGALRADRHEGRRPDIAVRRPDCPQSGPADGVFCDPCKFHIQFAYRISMQSP